MVTKEYLCTSCADVLNGKGVVVVELQKGDTVYRHHTTLTEFADAVADGCVVCCMLWDELQMSLVEVNKYTKKNGKVSAFVTCRIDFSATKEEVLPRLWLSLDSPYL